VSEMDPERTQLQPEPQPLPAQPSAETVAAAGPGCPGCCRTGGAERRRFHPPDPRTHRLAAKAEDETSATVPATASRCTLSTSWWTAKPAPRKCWRCSTRAISTRRNRQADVARTRATRTRVATSVGSPRREWIRSLKRPPSPWSPAKSVRRCRPSLLSHHQGAREGQRPPTGPADAARSARASVAEAHQRSQGGHLSPVSTNWTRPR